jgi:hypothetical protein
MSLVAYTNPGPAMTNPINATNEAATKSTAVFRGFDVDCDGDSYGFTNAVASVGERLR